MVTTKCPACGTDFESNKGAGRPALYCSLACRRDAEYAIRRINSLLLRAEKARQDLVIQEPIWRDEAAEKRKAERIDAEINRLRHRLRGLLGD